MRADIPDPKEGPHHVENRCAGGGRAGGRGGHPPADQRPAGRDLPAAHRAARAAAPGAQPRPAVQQTRTKAAGATALQTVSTAALAAFAAVCVCRRSGTALQIGMGLMLGGALANLIERWARGSVTDYVYLPRAVIPFFRRIIWNAADLSVLTGCITAVIALLCEKS